ncbi:MAG: hypothetical protein AAGJ73_08730 [Pseudomonadota bacterium]
MKMLFAAMMMTLAAATASAGEPAEKNATTDYEPMKLFERFAGRAMRGEGTGPDGKPVVNIATWKFIMDGRAVQSDHKLEGGTYGGRTIYFYDEGGEKYIYHYFTNAGFHTMGEVTPTDNGFASVEKVINHPNFSEVRGEMFFDGDVIRVTSTHVDKEGKLSETKEGFVYRFIDDPGALFQ